MAINFLRKLLSVGSASDSVVEGRDFRARPFVGIRMEAIGGQGAHSAGKILAEAAVIKELYTGNHFSSFGSEKRGTPVRSYVRFSTEHKPVRSSSPILSPHLLVIFHENLIESHPEIFNGITEDTDVIINTKKSPRDLVFPEIGKARMIGTLDATEIARSLQCGLNVVMMGAILQFVPEIKKSSLEFVLAGFFKRLDDHARKRNLQGLQAGYERMKSRGFISEQNHSFEKEQKLPLLGWENAPIGGVIVNPGNAILKDNSSSRKGLAPQLNTDICFHCGLCDMVCPDFCFVWDHKQAQSLLLGIDYQYCKACQKCVEVCPVQALTVVSEAEITDEQRKKKLYGN